VSYVLALDQGTTSSRAILFGREGEIVGVDQNEFAQHFPQPGWVEHDPLEIWESQIAAARGALAKAGVGAADLAAIGITNQRETALVWDRATGEPIYPAIVWQSRQTAPICEALRARGLDDEVRARTGLVIDAYFSGTKTKFILDRVAGSRERAARGELCFGTVDTWLVYQLTGGRIHATEYSNASRTLLYDVHEREWSDLLLRELEVPREMLPAVHDSSGVLGEADAHWLGASTGQSLSVPANSRSSAVSFVCRVIPKPDQRQSCARSTSFARSGFRSIKRATVTNGSSASTGKLLNRP